MKYKVIKAFPSTQKNWKVGDIISPNGFKGTCEIAPNWPEYFEEYNPILTTQDEVDLFEGDSYYFAWLKEPAHNQKILTPYYVNKITGLDSTTSFSKDAVFFKYLFKLEIYLESLRPKPLFVTEDGVDIFDGNSVYRVDKDFNLIRFQQWRRHFGEEGKPLSGNKMFYSEKEAENYIFLNKPCLSLNDIAPFCEHIYVPSFPGHSYDYTKIDSTKLEQLVKDKI